MITQLKKPPFFYQFLGAHSLLIGLLPFFLPVYLWQHGLGVPGLCILIGVSGLSFTAALWPWQYVSQRWPLRHLIRLTFALELLLVIIVGLLISVPGAALFTAPGHEIAPSSSQWILAAVVIGIANGAYNAFFWTTQRCLFLQQLGTNNSGRQYGNFQIFVTLILKVGILLGGFLLDTGGFVGLLALSAGISFAASAHLAPKAASSLHQVHSTTLIHSIRYSDTHGSRPVFAIDGFFLYLESHFWTLSLFLLVREDYSRLGLVVIVLALVFAVLFYLIKNRIDQLAVQRVYKVAVWLYACSWLLRFTLDAQSSGSGMLIALVLITFCASFFRLAFNKRFFDVAINTGATRYLLIKSYSSQSYLAIGFLLLGIVLAMTQLADTVALNYLYLPATALSLVYLRYRDPQ